MCDLGQDQTIEACPPASKSEIQYGALYATRELGRNDTALVFYLFLMSSFRHGAGRGYMADAAFRQV